MDLTEIFIARLPLDSLAEKAFTKVISIPHYPSCKYDKCMECKYYSSLFNINILKMSHVPS